jgi:hypothetical protein
LLSRQLYRFILQLSSVTQLNFLSPFALHILRSASTLKPLSTKLEYTYRLSYQIKAIVLHCFTASSHSVLMFVILTVSLQETL